jgi:hypothetical protein
MMAMMAEKTDRAHEPQQVIVPIFHNSIFDIPCSLFDIAIALSAQKQVLIR